MMGVVYSYCKLVLCSVVLHYTTLVHCMNGGIGQVLSMELHGSIREVHQLVQPPATGGAIRDGEIQETILRRLFFFYKNPGEINGNVQLDF